MAEKIETPSPIVALVCISKNEDGMIFIHQASDDGIVDRNSDSEGWEHWQKVVNTDDHIEAMATVSELLSTTDLIK